MVNPLIKAKLTRHAALGRVLMFAGGALATVLYALLAILTTPTVMQATTAAIAALVTRCLWTLVGILSWLEVLVMGYLYQLMLSRYRTEFRLYRTLGMPLWYLAGQLIGENLIWAGLTGGIGIGFGILGSKFFVMWLVRMMALPLNTGLLWSGHAAGQLLIGYALGYVGLAVSGWLRFCQPLGAVSRKASANQNRHKWWRRVMALLAPGLLLIGDLGLGHASAAPLSAGAWLALVMISLVGVCAFTLPAALRLVAWLPWIRQRAAWLLSVTTSRRLLQRRWLTMSLAAGLLSAAAVLLISGLVQYQALHTAKPPVSFLHNLITGSGVGVDAAAGITLFMTTLTSFAMIIAAAILLRLVQRLSTVSRYHATTLYQLGMPQTLLVQIQQSQSRVVGSLPLILGVLNARFILAEQTPLLTRESNAGWFIVVAVLLYFTVVQTTSYPSD